MTRERAARASSRPRITIRDFRTAFREPICSRGCANKHAAIVGLTTVTGKTYSFDTLYSALGCKIRSDLPRLLGAACDEREQVVVDDKLRTSVGDVYAAGDVANDLNQIAVATGHAAIAATAIHNALRKASG